MPTDGGLMAWMGAGSKDPRKSMNKKQKRAFYHSGGSTKKKFKRKK